MNGLVIGQSQNVQYPTDPELLARVMQPYQSKGCVYLKEALIEVASPSAEGCGVSADCRFEIPESCYIDDTGHFNSVEFNICFNQMAYYLLAKAVKDKLVLPFSAWSMADFWQRQLGDILITDFKSAFRAHMNGRTFRGRIELMEIITWDGSDIRDPLLVVRSRCRYWDSHGGDCHGEVNVAITNPPVLAAA